MMASIMQYKNPWNLFIKSIFGCLAAFLAFVIWAVVTWPKTNYGYEGLGQLFVFILLLGIMAISFIITFSISLLRYLNNKTKGKIYSERHRKYIKLILIVLAALGLYSIFTIAYDPHHKVDEREINKEYPIPAFNFN